MSEAEIEWVTPAEASEIARLGGLAGERDGRVRILQRARSGLIRARVRDVVKRTLRKLEPSPAPAPGPNGVVPLGTPLPIWEWPVETERRSNEPLETDDWEAPGLSDPADQWWQTGDLELSASNGSREGVSMFGIEFCKADLEGLRSLRRAPAAPTPPSPVAPAAATPAARPLAKEALRAWLSQHYAVASGPLDWKRDVWPAAKAAFPSNSVTRAAVEEQLRELGHIATPGRPLAQ